MKEIKDFLMHDYCKNILKPSKDCPSSENLCDYTRGALHSKEKEEIELHLARCYHCLDRVISIHDGLRFHNSNMPTNLKRRRNMKKENIFLILAIACFISSFMFSRYFLQFLAATIILGVKWIVEGKTNRMLIMIYEAWKKEGNRGPGRILRDIDIKNKKF